jgi:hypothetical protein
MHNPFKLYAILSFVVCFAGIAAGLDQLVLDALALLVGFTTFYAGGTWIRKIRERRTSQASLRTDS